MSGGTILLLHIQFTESCYLLHRFKPDSHINVNSNPVRAFNTFAGYQDNHFSTIPLVFYQGSKYQLCSFLERVNSSVGTLSHSPVANAEQAFG
jgi:hypothetical protein